MYGVSDVVSTGWQRWAHYSTTKDFVYQDATNWQCLPPDTDRSTKTPLNRRYKKIWLPWSNIWRSYIRASFSNKFNSHAFLWTTSLWTHAVDTIINFTVVFGRVLDTWPSGQYSHLHLHKWSKDLVSHQATQKNFNRKYVLWRVEIYNSQDTSRLQGPMIVLQLRGLIHKHETSGHFIWHTGVLRRGNKKTLQWCWTMMM